MAVEPPWHPKSDWQPNYVLRSVPQEIPSSTAPSLVVTDAGNGYVKMPSNPQGPAALVSELVGTMLADWFGLPTFEYALINASPADLDSESRDETPVSAFITMEEPGEPWKGTKKELKRLSNPEDINKLVVFDTWLGNFDRYSIQLRHAGPREHRNEGNVFLSHRTQPKKLKLTAYDHTHCQIAVILASPHVEILGKIEDPAVYGNFPEFGKLIQRHRIHEAAQKLVMLEGATVEEVVKSIPDEWLLVPAARSLVAEFVKRRAKFVGESIERKLFPQGELDL